MTEQPTGGRLDRPILIISAPRSGSTLLFETLAGAPGVFTPGGESHQRIEMVAGLSPRDRDWSSNVLGQSDATPETAAALTEAFARDLRDRDGKAPTGPARMIEKTPKNALRIPFFDAIWPDSRFVYLYRDPRETMSSMIEAWQIGNFRTYPGLPGWSGPPWSLLLVPGWETLRGMPLPQIVAHQWATTTMTALDSLEQRTDRTVALDYRTFLATPQPTVESLTAALELGWDRDLGRALPLSRYTMSRPEPGKWKRHAEAIEAVWPIVAEADERARAFVQSRSI